MTNNQNQNQNQLTDLRIEQILEKVGVFTLDMSQDLQDVAAALRELQERRKAERDSEPVAWTDDEELRDANVAGIGYLFGIDREANKFADPRRQIVLYRHAQPAPETEREPIAWLNDAYLARGVVDGEAGSEDVGPGYIPVYREASPAQPAPVVQCPFPCGWDNLNKLAIQNAAFVACALVAGEPATESLRQAVISNNDYLLKVISASRAAMLQVGTLTNEDTKQAWTGIPDIDNAIIMLDRISTAESEDDDRVEAVKAVLRGLAGNSPVIGIDPASGPDRTVEVRYVAPPGYVMVPRVPSQAHLNSIAMRYRHDFYLLNDAQKDSALATARQMYEECSGQGFYTLPAAPQEVKGE
ncbi:MULTISPECIES: hypothetical protein [unclassified Raoultella]|uniref:hypothetical protein n=1 Tax=unclassified Raoultella TaxID=2627600 RepID=UPI001D0F506E